MCDAVLDWTRKGGKPHALTPTLDRINNDPFILRDNIQIICHRCNTTKNNRTLVAFVEYCKKIVAKYQDTALIIPEPLVIAGRSKVITEESPVL